MNYWLGIDVGTTLITAALCRETAGGGSQPEVVALGTHSAALRSVVYLGQDDQVVVGDAAERRAAAEPDRVVREVKRHLGDEAPMLIGGVPHPAVGIIAAMVGWVVDKVGQQQGGPARGATITHPASWDAGRVQALADALTAVPVPVTLRAEPEAAALSYSIRQRIDVGSTLAVYDLGGATFEAAVLRKTGTSTFSTLGIPEGIERLGGADFDDAVFGHVLAAVPALSELDPEATGQARLQRSLALCRRECAEAKQALSVDTEVTIPVLLPRVQSQVTLTRTEFEELIRPQVVETVDALRRTLRSADVALEDLDAVLLIGGSSRIPLVAQLLSAELGHPVTVDPDPQAAIALGAAASGLRLFTTGVNPGPAAPTPVVASPDPPAQSPPWVAAAPPDVAPSDAQRARTGSPRLATLAAAGLLALVAVGGAVTVPLLTAHRGPASAPAAGTPPPQSQLRSVTAAQPPVPPIPVSQIPVSQIPPAPETPAATVAAIPDPQRGLSSEHTQLIEAAATPPAAPARSRTPARRPGVSRPTSRPRPPVTTPPPPSPANIPDWVKSARNGS